MTFDVVVIKKRGSVNAVLTLPLVGLLGWFRVADGRYLVSISSFMSRNSPLAS